MLGDKNKRVSVHLSFNDAISEEMADSTWQEVFDILGVFDKSSSIETVEIIS